MPSNSALPVETLDAIVQEFISALPEGTENNNFLPRRQRHLAPLLYVSKLWHAVTERNMYRVISIGKTIGSTSSDIALMMLRQEKSFRIAKKLLDSLQAHPRLAAYVEILELATMSGKDIGQITPWTQINTQIIQACPNVKHVENLANYDLYPNPDLKNLTAVLKEKSLLCLSLTHDGIVTNICKSELSLYDILSSWPKLQSLRVDGFHLSEVPKGEAILRCPELREIKVVNCEPLGNHYDLLRNFTDRVTKFYITSIIKESRELYKCLRTWSKTLTHLRIRVKYNDYNEIEGMDYSPLWDVVSTLTELRELQIFAESNLNSTFTFVLRLSFIVSLSKLERFCIAPRWDYRWPDIDALKTAKHLPSLRHIVCWYTLSGFTFGRDMRLICDERNIKLEKWNEIWRNSKIPGFAL